MDSICIYSGKVDINDIHDLRQHTEHALKQRGLDDDTCANLVIVVEEWISNIVNYAYQGKKGELELEVDVNDSQARICIRDQGPEFNITLVKATQIKDVNSPDAKPGGLGIELIRRLVDDLDYSRSEDGWNQSCFRRNIQ